MALFFSYIYTLLRLKKINNNILNIVSTITLKKLRKKHHMKSNIKNKLSNKKTSNNFFLILIMGFGCKSNMGISWFMGSNKNL